MERQIHAYCDQCGAEGPYIVGERRPALIKELLRLGWRVTDGGGHFCMECAHEVKITPVLPPIDGPIQPPDVIDAMKSARKTIMEDQGEDRSKHWTEARKEPNK